MFAYFAAALQGCKLIVEEDAGDFYSEGDLKRPDFRILSHEGEEFFVEVKNFNQTDPSKPYVLDVGYVTKLTGYAGAFGKPLLFAIYWRCWGVWTVNLLSTFSLAGIGLQLDFCDALKFDQKSRLGDRWIGISKPLSIRFFTDESSLRTVGVDGTVKFTIGRVAFFAAGREVEDEYEIQLANFFLNFGRWEDFNQSTYVKDNELVWIELEGVCADSNPEQDFVFIGSLSEMITRQFNSLTVEDGKVIRLSPKIEPHKLGVVIPPNFKGDVLGVWQFNQKC